LDGAALYHMEGQRAGFEWKMGLTDLRRPHIHHAEKQRCRVSSGSTVQKPPALLEGGRSAAAHPSDQGGGGESDVGRHNSASTGVGGDRRAECGSILRCSQGVNPPHPLRAAHPPSREKTGRPGHGGRRQLAVIPEAGDEQAPLEPGALVFIPRPTRAPPTAPALRPDWNRGSTG
jgi:hypothetical protein